MNRIRKSRLDASRRGRRPELGLILEGLEKREVLSGSAVHALGEPTGGGRAPTAVVETVSTPTSVFGQTITLGATVTRVGSSVVPTGVVRFLDRGRKIGEATLDSSGHASLDVKNLLVGTHGIVAVYSGDAGDQPGTSSVVTETVSKDPTTTTLALSTAESIAGQNVTLTATVVANAPSTAKPFGIVIFKDGDRIIGSTKVDVNGQATIGYGFAKSGNHSIMAVYYPGDGFVSSASAVTTLKVNPGVASRVLMRMSETTVVGRPNSLTLGVVDDYGNLIQNYVGTIHFSSSDTGATLPADYTFSAGDSGTHTFAGVVFATPGPGTITAADTVSTGLKVTRSVLIRPAKPTV